jgi:hypothetical protein
VHLPGLPATDRARHLDSSTSVLDKTDLQQRDDWHMFIDPAKDPCGRTLPPPSPRNAHQASIGPLMVAAPTLMTTPTIAIPEASVTSGTRQRVLDDGSNGG